jgi:hypothetical protein
MEPDTFLGQDKQHPHGTLLLQLAVLAQEHIRDHTDHEYQLGIRDTCLTVVALTLTKGTGRDPDQVRHLLTDRLTSGECDAPQLLQLGLQAVGHGGAPRMGLDWVGPRTFQARHDPSGTDENLANSLGPNRSIRISWRRDPGRHVGLLYAYDQLWDEYAVIAACVDRDLAREACRRAVPSRGAEL